MIWDEILAELHAPNVGPFAKWQVYQTLAGQLLTENSFSNQNNNAKSKIKFVISTTLFLISLCGNSINWDRVCDEQWHE